MNFFPISRLKTGIEISSDKIISALILEKGKKFSIKKLSDIKIPPGTIKPSFKKENIINAEALHDCLKKACYDMNLKKISVALPDSSVKVLIKKFTQLPEDPQEINEMVLWNFSSSLDLPVKQLRVSWENMGKSPDNHHIFLIVLGLEKVMVQYENAFKKIGISPVMLAPSGLNQFNFYCESLPEKGNVAYLGLFDDFLNIFVFSNGIPIFYKMIKKGLLGNDGASAINNVDFLIQYYNSENPDLDIEKFFIASHIKSDMLMEHILQDVSQIGSHIKSDMLMEHILQDGNPIDCTIIDERQLIDFDKKFKIDFKNNPLPFYTTALGAAQGL
ncbi:MAG: hypothetical protein K8S13_15415 [Desulfobacula sp.]|uniref:type IV pilus biogenesis protein PilM n=1 Tax=Desulfobacula sp. TaxID=2593537 RepID=UPI0025B97748|nr:hypothetical protein [Desulfobacula sp.]MCD4721228.1 hypothetical protein [Desulfobacula sp.]